MALTSLITALAAAQASSSSRSTEKRPSAQGKFPEATGNVALNDEAELARAILHYDSGRYRECVDEIEPLVTEGSPRVLKEPELVERGQVYLAACLIGIGEPERADEVLRAAIRKNPQMSPPDGLVFPQPVIDRFLQVRQQLMDEIRRLEQQSIEKAQRRAEEQAQRLEAERWRTKELEYLASQQLIIRDNSRWLAALPFGVGQFQNRDPTLGWVFLGSELAMAATMVGALAVDRFVLLPQQEDPQLSQEGYNAVTQHRWTAYTVFVASSWAFIGTAAAGIVQAQIAFVPEFRDVETRALPGRLRSPQSPTPVSFGPLLPSGGSLRFTCRF